LFLDVILLDTDQIRFK